MLKSIILPMTPGSPDNSSIAAAADLAKVFQACVTGLFVRSDPRSAVPFMGEGLTADMIQQLCDTAERQGLAQAEEGHDRFTCIMAEKTIPVIDEGGGDDARAHWSVMVGAITDHVGRRARVADLAVCQQPGDDDGDARDILHELLFRSGRALLMVPRGTTGAIGRRVMIAWNGRAEGARAIANAMPFLKRADSVHLVQIGDIDAERSCLEDLAAYLAEHGVTGRIDRRPDDPRDVGSALLAVAGEIDADLMVIGAYSHARWREMVLGGVTRSIVADAGIPVFMSH